MISKLYRFHRRGALNYVYKKGRTVRTEYLSLRYVPSRNQDYRLAVVVSKKVSKSAVKRNRIRRRIYEIVRLHRKSSGRPMPFDLVLTVFDERLGSMPTEELQQTVTGLLKKADL